MRDEFIEIMFVVLFQKSTRLVPIFHEYIHCRIEFNWKSEHSLSRCVCLRAKESNHTILLHQQWNKRQQLEFSIYCIASDAIHSVLISRDTFRRYSVWKEKDEDDNPLEMKRCRKWYIRGPIAYVIWSLLKTVRNGKYFHSEPIANMSMWLGICHLFHSLCVSICNDVLITGMEGVGKQINYSPPLSVCTHFHRPSLFPLRLYSQRRKRSNDVSCNQLTPQPSLFKGWN